MVRAIKKQSRYSFTHRVILLVKFFLIKVGEIPLLVSLRLWHLLKKLPQSFHTHSWKPKKGKRAILIILIPALIVGYIFFASKISQALPSPYLLKPSDKPLTSEVYDRNGVVIYRFYNGINRSLINLDDLPPYVWEASIAIEDKNFFRHPGVDPLALIRAAWLDLTQHLDNQDLQGGSTITQQLVKNTLLTPNKTITRKLKELALALWAERIFSKKQILEMYLNESPYGGPSWGIEAASLTYFGKHAKDLNLAQAAFLAGLPASPTEYGPYSNNPLLGKGRQKLVLQKMVEINYISQAQANEAMATPLKFIRPTGNILAPHFVMYLRDYLSQKYSEKELMEGGLKITTTLDLWLQEKTEQIVKEEVDKVNYLNVGNGAAMVTDPKTGQILAMVGSKDYSNPNFGNYNAALALRQPGSSIKVITYATAFKQGFSPGNTILDMPVSFPDGDRQYAPINYDGRFHGPVSIRTALGSSFNIPAVKTLATVGIDEMIKTAKDMGITTFNDRPSYGLSITLGGADVRLIDMMAVYDTLADSGIFHQVTPILKIQDSYNHTLEDYQDQGKEALTPEVAYLVTNILSDDQAREPAFGYHSLLYIPGHSVAVKTGTSDNKRDNWTFGYNPNYVVGVWVGNNDNTPMNPILSSGITGASPIWNRLVHMLVDGTPDVAFTRPKGIIDTTIDGRRDLAIAGNVPRNLVQIYHEEENVVFADPFSRFATPSASQQPVKN